MLPRGQTTCFLLRAVIQESLMNNQPKECDTNSNSIIESQLHDHVQKMGSRLKSDVVTFLGPILGGADSLIRDAVESIDKKKPKVSIVLETPGGSIEVVQRIVDCVRHHYETVWYVIPNFAMSAGTILVMSGDAIYMDYYSVLGPIDPQVERPGVGMIPALGYLIQYERLIDKSKKGKLTTAELTLLVEKFDQAELYQYEQARELSISLLKEWLVKYKFKNWTKTKTRKLKVTKGMKDQRAVAIAKRLNETKHWHSHSRGISMEVLRRDLNLQIEDFGQDAELNQAIRAYYQLLRDYMMRRGHSVAVHTNGRYVAF
jgi:hypothetical protein